jgi:hypothetical protein
MPAADWPSRGPRAETKLSRGQFTDPKLGRIRLDDWVRPHGRRRALRPTTRVAKRSAFSVHIVLALGASRSAPSPRSTFAASSSNSRSVGPPSTGTVCAALCAAVDADLLAVSPCRGVKLLPKRPLFPPRGSGRRRPRRRARPPGPDLSCCLPSACAGRKGRTTPRPPMPHAPSGRNPEIAPDEAVVPTFEVT